MSAALKVMGGLLLAAYPIAVWAGLSVADSRAVGLVLLVVLGVAVPLRFLRRRGEQVWELIGSAGALIVLVLLTILLDDRRFLLYAPVLVNVILLAGFGSSLLKGRVPVVERFARLVHPDLTPDRVLHCRTVTKVWCLFFIVNGVISLWLALFASISAWAVYTGGISYLLIGALFVGEYAIRRIRFG